MIELMRRNIPVLKEKKTRKGSLVIVARNFAHGDEFIRIYQGAALSLQVEFAAGTPEVSVCLHSNVSGEWADYEFRKVGEQVYAIDHHCGRPGVYQFKVKYSHNQGKTWYWDTIPPSSFMVDPIELKGLRLYTLIPTVCGHIGNWITELHRIKKLGFNAVHLLPLTELDSSRSPYSAHDLFEIDSCYAIPGDERSLANQLDGFVREAKDLGLKLCFDVVLNHVGVTSKISTLSPDWIASDTTEADGLKRAGCWDRLSWHPWHDLVLVKYDHPMPHTRREIWDYMSDYLMFWANYAHYTGGLMRLDNLHSTNRDFLNFALKRLRAEFPDLIVFAELFTDPQTTQRMVYFHELNLLLATPWITPYAEQYRQFLRNLHMNAKVRYLLSVSSHDSGTPAQEYGSPDAVVPRYAACALLGGGQAGFVQGAEFGAPKKLQFIGRTEPLAMDAETWGHDYSERLRALNEFVAGHPHFLETGNIEFVDGNHGAVLAALRHDCASHHAFLVLISFDTRAAHEIEISFETAILKGRKKMIREAAKPPEPFTSLGANAVFRIEPCEVKIFELRY